jgi:hypothetical protein
MTTVAPTPAAPTPSPSAAAPPRDNQQTTMTQHYGVSAGPKMKPLSSGWMQLTSAATNRLLYYHKATSRRVFSRAEMILKSQLQEILCRQQQLNLSNCQTGL